MLQDLVHLSKSMLTARNLTSYGTSLKRTQNMRMLFGQNWPMKHNLMLVKQPYKEYLRIIIKQQGLKLGRRPFLMKKIWKKDIASAYRVCGY